MPAEVRNVEAQGEAGVEKVVPRRHLVVFAVDADRRHPLPPGTAFEFDMTLELFAEAFQAASERLHGAGSERAESPARAEKVGVHGEDLHVASFALAGL